MARKAVGQRKFPAWNLTFGGGIAFAVVFSGAARSQSPFGPQADLLITGVAVADVETGSFRSGQNIAVVDGKIAYIGPASPDWQSAKRTIDGSRSVALPGFVDTHTHLWQHAARGLVPAGNLQEWAPTVYKPAHHTLPGEVHDLTRAAAAQGLLNGVTTVSDFASTNFTETADAETVAALRELHIGGVVVWWRPAVFLPWKLQDRELAALRSSAGTDLSIWVGFGPLSFMPLPMVYDGIQTAKRNKLRMTEHAMENLKEARDFASLVTKYKQSANLRDADAQLLNDAIRGAPIPQSDALLAMSRTRDDLLSDPVWSAELTLAERQALGALPELALPSQLKLLDNWGALDGFLAIHSVWPTPEDLEIYKKRGASISHNPESNMYLSSGVAPLRQYLANGIPVTLGTDGAASNDRISMFDAMRAAWLLQKVSTLQPAVTARFDGWYFLRAATINGANALGIGNRTGSLVVGKEADILLLDKSGLSAAPWNEATAATRLVTSAEARDLNFVIADGVVMVENGHLASGNEKGLADDLTRIAAALQEREANGKTWSEAISLSAATRDAARRYRVIRWPDTIQLTVTNSAKTMTTVTLAFAGSVFGGRAPMTMHPASLARYPAATPKQFARYMIALAPGETFSVEKSKGSATFTIKHGSDTLTHDSPEQDQLAIFVD